MYPFERFTEEAKKVFTLAQEEAERGQYSYIGTEHLLLGILRSPEGAGGEALRALGVEIGAVRRAIETVIGRDVNVLHQQLIPTSRVKKVIEMGFEDASALGQEFVDSGHILVALTREGEGIAAHVLEDLGASLQRVVAAVGIARKAMPAPRTSAAGTTRGDIEGSNVEVLRGVLQTPLVARLLESKGLDVEAVVELLSRPPEEVVRLRRYVADLRREMKAMADAKNYEKAANLQKGEKDLLRRLAEVEKAWIDGLQPS